MANIDNYETKQVECLKCGWVGAIAKFIPLKQAWCGSCRSSQLRIYHVPNTSGKRTVEDCRADHDALRFMRLGPKYCPECGIQLRTR